MKLWKHDIAFDPNPALIGFLQGLAFYLTYEITSSADLWRKALVLFLILTPGILMLALRPHDQRRDLVVAFGVGGFFAGLLALLQVTIGTDSRDGILGGYSGYAIISGFILLCFHQAGRDGGWRAIPYARLFETAWNNMLSLQLSALFTATVWLVLTLWGKLFKLIGLDIFETLFTKDWFAWPFYCAIFGLGIALLRGLEAPIQTVRRLTLATFRVLAVIVAFAGLLFLLALPFTGLSPLWETRQATPILLSMVIAFILFVNGAIEDGRNPQPFWPPVTLLIRAFLVALPLYGLLALYSVWLRIDQYGLTPDRIAAFLSASLAVLFGLAYAAPLFLRRRGWVEGLTLVNPGLALLAVAIFVLAHIPGLDPASLSARNQLARLQAGKIAAVDFDFGLLRFDLGKPGRAALEKIRTDPALAAKEDIRIALAELATMQDRNEWRAHQRKAQGGLTGARRDKLLTTLDGLPVFPSSALPPQRFLPALLEMSPDLARSCANRDPETDAPCSLILLDFNRDGYDDTAIWTGGNSVTLYIWNSPKDRYEPPMTLSASGPLTLDILRAADKAGDIRIVPARVDSLVIGDTRFD